MHAAAGRGNYAFATDTLPTPVFLRSHYEPLEKRTYLAFAQLRDGETLLKRCGFAMILLPEQNEQHSPLYVLRPSEAAIAIDRFERTDDFLSSRTKLKNLDERLGNVELQLRALIASTLGTATWAAPGELSSGVANAMAAAIDDMADRQNLRSIRRIPHRVHRRSVPETKSTSFVSGPHAAPIRISKAPTTTRTRTVYLNGMKWASNV
jgi:hypothetical protein